MSKLTNYLKESYNELVSEVTWPTWKSLQSTSVKVLVASVIIALILLVMDLSGKSVLEWYYEIV